MNRLVKFGLPAACLIFIPATWTFAGPPFLTDDPEPVDYQHWEFYVFANGDHARDGSAINGPAAELNYGVLPDMQLHLVTPVLTLYPDGGPSTTGLGDMEFGIKYRFLHETDKLPQIGIFPMAEFPTGNADRGLGNGQTWFRLPLWLQKSWGPWTTYGGGGVALNPAPGQRNYPFGGWLVQRDFGPHLTLGGEVFGQGRDVPDSKGFATLNFGGSYNFNEHFSLLFSAGHSIAGDRHTFWYFGLYWTWGGGKSAKP